MRRKTIGAITALAISLSASLAMAETLWVKSESVDILGGKGAVFPILASVPKGQELTVVSHDGKWIQVQAPGGVTGWVYEASLSSQKIDKGGFSIAPGGVAQANTSAAGRGLFDPSTEQYAAGRNLNKAPLEHLITLRKTITPAEFEKFTQSMSTPAPR